MADGRAHQGLALGEAQVARLLTVEVVQRDPQHLRRRPARRWQLVYTDAGSLSLALLLEFALQYPTTIAALCATTGTVVSNTVE
jgi:hypothetical protein